MIIGAPSIDDLLLSEEDIKLMQQAKEYCEKRTALDAKIDQTLSEIQQILGITL